MEENKNFENGREPEENENTANPPQKSEPAGDTTEEDAQYGGEQQEEREEDGEKFNLGREVFEWLQAIVVALVIALALRTYVFTLVNVEGASMEPTLHDGDRLIVTRLGYVPKQGDIIIFRPKYSPNTPYVKRVIAVPGQTVDIDYNQGKVYVNGKEIYEPYIKAATHHRGTMQLPVTVPEGSVFVLGDNRNNSRDSRFTDVGMVTDDTIIGHAVYRLWPFNSVGSVK